MKRLEPISTDQVELEVAECECGFHIGLDATFMEQVSDFVIQCPSCSATLDTAKVFPADENPSTITGDDDLDEPLGDACPLEPGECESCQ